ncbi:MAG TPA: LytTR family DNA-binding domain-containing protein [Thermoanaerobaculia bacterium]|nr:LytTR family DNA-binding domain-containing protein [Thermoanaerobaculia bacterium]
MTELRVVIADDEAPARRKLRRLLERDASLSIVGEASTGPEAVRALRAQRPQALFLDIQMPGLDGFQVLEALGDLDDTAVVFVTAYDEYAVRAFEIDALDYLLKPVTEERLSKVLERLCAHVERRAPDARARQRFWKRILVESARRAHFVKVDEIDWIETDRNYLILHCGAHRYLVRATLKDFLERLDPVEFARVNRSAAVNLDRVRELRPRSHGDYSVTLRGEQELVWSRRYAASALERFLPLG